MPDTVTLIRVFIKSVETVKVNSRLFLYLLHMSRKRSWSDKDLHEAVKRSTSLRGVLLVLNLIPAGGNYQHVMKAIESLGIDISHFSGKGWRKGRQFDFVPKIELSDILKKDSSFQSFKLKRRLFRVGLKSPKCELCGWAE